MLGVVNLDKPVGPTSHDMVSLLRRLTGTRRIGHAGTLDPLASGVLPVLVGAATRFSEELTAGDKRYDALIRLGQRSATDDAQGPLEAGNGPLPDREAVESALQGFAGRIRQRPPAYSARKLAGRRAHRAARSGEPLELDEREVTIHGIEVLRIEAGEAWVDVRIDLRCGPGTYVRSLARDLGELLGCGGHLHALRRTEAAGLRVVDARTPVELEELHAAGRLDEALLPVVDLLPLPRIALDAAAAARFAHGSSQPVTAGPGRHVVLRDGELLGLGMVHEGFLRPTKVVSGSGEG